jgi:heme/copper-type cytochrome/quinol oxidase subunit 2
MGRVAVVVAAAAVAIGTLAGCGHGTGTASGSNPGGVSAKPPAASTTVRTINVKVRGGKATGDTGRIAVATNTPIVLSVSSDVADEIHVHGYDRKANVPAGATAAVTFTANTPGVFEIELENSKLQLLQLQVG